MLFFQKPDRLCVYCKELVKNGTLPRHIKRHHKTVKEVQDILTKPADIRNRFFMDKIREGIYEYNVKQMGKGSDPQTYMRERKPKLTDKVRMCSNCKKFLSNKYFWKHKCAEPDGRTSVNPSLLQTRKVSNMDKDDEFVGILNRFRDGPVGNMCRTNETVKLVGYRHFCLRRHEEGKHDETRKVVMAEMRELSKLVLEFKSISGEDKSAEDMFVRQNLDDLVQVVKQLSTDHDTGSEKHGQKLFFNAVIKRSIKSLTGHYAQTMQDDKVKELKHFKKAYNHKSAELYPKARQTCIKNSLEKGRRPQNLPNESAVRMLKEYINAEVAHFTANFTLKNYAWLRSLIVAKLTLYNARRGEEASRMLVSEWEEAERGIWLPDSEVEKVEDPAEKYLLGKYKLAYLKGKGRKYVPVLVPLDLVDSINILKKNRSKAKVSSKNMFIFATKKGISHCSGWHAVSDVCKRAKISLPVNATKMRHRLSNLFASMDMSAENQKIFLDHMGHELRINQENYQCPQGLREVSVMGKMLSNIEGTCHTVPY